MDFEYVETTVYNQRRNNGDFQLAGRLPPSIPTRSSSLPPSIEHSAKGFNGARYDNPKVTTLLEQACSTLDESMRKDLYGQAQKIVMEELPYLPTVQEAGRTGRLECREGRGHQQLANVDFWPVWVEA